MQVGAILPLQYQSVDYNTGKYPSAIVYDDTFTPIGSPIPLASISNGFYESLAANFPAGTNFVVVQILVYDDAGRTILSSSQGGEAYVIYLDNQPQGSKPIAAVAQIASYDPSLFARAFIRDQTGAPIPGSPVNLLPIGTNGLYASSAAQMPNSSAFVSLQFAIYSDSGYTTLSPEAGGGTGIIYLPLPPSSALPSNTGLVGILDSLLQNPINGVQDELVTNSDRILNMRITRSDNGDPYDLTGASNIQARFLNADETVLVVQMTDPGSPVTISNAGAGMFNVSVTKAQSALFKPMNPAPLSVVIVQPGGQIICNFPYQLVISAEINP